MTAEYDLIGEFEDAVKHGQHDIGHKWCALFDSDAWRDYRTPLGRPVRHADLLSFITNGLGLSLERLQQVLAGYEPALQRLRKAIPAAHIHGANQHNGGLDNINSSEGGGTRSTYTLARLKRDRPDLAEQVVDGSLSANAAAIEAGFRRRTVQVPVDDVEALARTLQRRLAPGEVAQLVALLLTADETSDRQAS